LLDGPASYSDVQAEVSDIYEDYYDEAAYTAVRELRQEGYVIGGEMIRRGKRGRAFEHSDVRLTEAGRELALELLGKVKRVAEGA
jgi:hypothetical protein